jgi:DNA-directed RNA polymerase subunit RPC12/RpoP
VLRFTCPYCSVKLSAGEDRAGKKVHCPKCKGKILLSDPSGPEPPAVETETDDLKLIDSPKPLNGDLLELEEKKARQEVSADDRRREEELRASILGKSSPEYSGERKLPWPIDVLLYPLSGPGLIILGIVIVIPLLIDLARGMLGPFAGFILVPGLIVDGVILLYFLWYVAECIRDSGLGGVRAPDTLAQSPGLSEMFSRMGRTFACIAVSLLPLSVYWWRVRTTDATYSSLLALGVAICPMALVSATMHDSIGGLNPFLLVVSVLRTFLSYLGLILILGLMTFLLFRIQWAVADDFVLRFVVGNAEYYPMLIAAHLVGRFYWRNRERLDWIV